jgi:glycosyltransferase involved in cell wall biosynthesis
MRGGPAFSLVVGDAEGTVTVPETAEERSREPLVVHVIPSPDARGGQREARALADWLDEPGVRRHRVLSLTGGPGGGEGQVAVDYFVDAGRGGAATTVGFDPRLVLRLRRTLARLDPALLVAHGGEPLKFLVAAHFRRRPLAYYAIGTLAPQGQRPLRRTMWRYLARRPDLVVAEGTEVFDECRTVLGVAAARLVFVPNGRDPDEFRPDPDAAPRPEPVVTFVGALNDQKRPDRFVEVVTALRARGLGLRAQAVGDGPMRASLEPSAAAAGVELLGARGDVAEILRGTDVMVFPSLPRGEGMPGVLIEAGLSGVPVVATDAPGVSTIVADGETGVVVAVDDLEAMVDAAAALIADPLRRQTMGHEARRRCVERFSMETVANGWRSALLPLLAGR